MPIHMAAAMKSELERDDKKWEPVFVPKSHDNKNLERTFDSIKCDLMSSLARFDLFHPFREKAWFAL